MPALKAGMTVIWDNATFHKSPKIKALIESVGCKHETPADLKQALLSNSKALEAWEDITPLARNEWICWIESAKKAETRTKRIKWGCENLEEGKRRPCCWAGCSHR